MDKNSKDAAWVTLREMLEAKRRGDRITAQDIIDATGFDEWRSFGRRIRTWATNKGYVLFPVRNDGWRIGLAREHVDKAEQRRRAALRHEAAGFNALVSTPSAELTDRELRRHELAITRSQARIEIGRRHHRELSPRRIDAAERTPILRTGEGE